MAVAIPPTVYSAWPTVATVREDGTVVGVAAGKTKVRAQIAGKTLVANVTVNQQVTGIELTGSGGIGAQKSIQLKAVVTPSNAKNKAVTYGDNIQMQVSPGVMAYISRYDNTTKTGYRFSLDQFDGKKLKSRLSAENIKYDTLGRWHLNSYTMRRFNGLKESMTTGATLDTMLNFEPRDFLISKNDEQTMTSPELRQYIDQQHARGVAGIMNFEVEYERRYAMTAAAFILTVIGLSLSSRKVRGGMGMNIGIGLLLSFSYILFMTVTSTFAVSGYTSARVAMWIPNILYTLIAIWLYRRAAR